MARWVSWLITSRRTALRFASEVLRNAARAQKTGTRAVLFLLAPREKPASLAQEFDLTNLYDLCYKSHLVSHINSSELFVLEIEIE